MASDDLIEQLQSLGLTEYQSRGYAAAVRLGTSSPSELADASDVPQPRIYDVIDDLQEMELVEVQELSGSKRVSAPPPEDALGTFQQRHIDQYTSTVQAALTDLKQLYQGETDTGGFVTMVGLRESALRHIRRAIDDAEWWLSLALPLEMYEEIAEEVETALDRGVTVRLVLPDDDVEDDLEFPDALEIRHRKLRDRLAVADRKYGVFSSAAPRRDSEPFIITRQSDLVFLLQNFFDQFWPGSAELQPGGGLPRRYLDPWRTVVDLRETIDRGEDLVATITGYRDEENRVGTWSGRLVDYELYGPVPTDYTVVIPTDVSLYVEVDGERLRVGGRKAILSDIAADGIEISEG